MAGSKVLGNILYYFRANNSDFKFKAKEIKDTLKEVEDRFNKNRPIVRQWSNDFKTSVNNALNFVKQSKDAIQSVAITSGAVLGAMILELKKATKENVAFKNSLTGLQSVAGGLGEDLDKTTQAARDLVKDGLMGITDAATGLKNLLMAGFSLDQSIVIMNRFKDSAAFGRQAALTFGEAIRSATEGIKNGNSILVDNAGVTKNLSIMLEEAGYSQNSLMKASTDAGIRQAIYNGILRETRFQVGDATKLSNNFGGALSRAGESVNRLHRALGEANEKTLKIWVDRLNDVVTKVSEWIENNKELVGTLTLILGSLAAGVLTVSTFALALSKVIGAFKLIKTFIIGSDLMVYFGGAIKGAWSFSTALGAVATSFTPLLIGGAIIAGLVLIVNLFRQMAAEADRAKRKVSDFNSVEDITKEKARLNKNIDTYQADILTFKKGLDSPLYNDKAKGEFRTALQDRVRLLNDAKQRLTDLTKQEDTLNGVNTQTPYTPEITDPSKTKKSPYQIAKETFDAISAEGKWSLEKQLKYWEEEISKVKKTEDEKLDYRERTAELTNKLNEKIKESSDKLLLAQRQGLEKQLLELDQSMAQELQDVEANSERDKLIRERYGIEKLNLIKKYTDQEQEYLVNSYGISRWQYLDYLKNRLKDFQVNSEEWIAASQKIKDLENELGVIDWKQIDRDINTALRDGLVNNLSDAILQAKKLDDVFLGIRGLLQQIGSMIIQKGVIEPFVNSLFPKFHMGGLIYAHSGLLVPGLKPDEVPIIAQTGEQILNRQETKQYQGLLRNGIQAQVNMINNGTPAQVESSEVNFDGEKFVINAVMKDFMSNGPTRLLGGRR